MSIAIRIIIAIVFGCAAWAAAQALPQLPSIALYIAAAVASAILPASARAEAGIAEDRTAEPRDKASAGEAGGAREEGSVKWFNVSKGFGFITKDNGDEIFVHFRSIRGDGRRALRDGQRVSFVEAHTDKGPQAEDVEPL